MTIGIVGCGKMGTALTEGAISAGVFDRSALIAYDRVPAAIGNLGPGVRAAASLEELVSESEILLLCVKPGDVPAVLAVVSDVVKDASDLLIISIAAGVTLSQMSSQSKDRARFIRVMPNTPSLIGEGAAAFSLGKLAQEEDAQFTEKLLSSVGKVFQVEEKLIDPVTGLSGSGPAYVYTFIEALAEGALLEGLPYEQALALATQTVIGAAKMVAESKQHPAVLRSQVTSPGGTTIAGLAALEEGKFRSTVIKGVQTATAKSRELGA